MGFTIEEKVDCTRFGIQVANCYVTIKHAYQVTKNGSSMMPMGNSLKKYQYTTRYFIYAAADYANIQPLFDDQFVCSFDEPVVSPVDAVYEALKAQKFDALTLTDC